MYDRLPEWAQPVAEYIIETGLKNTLIIASVSVVLAVLIGVVLGTFLTIRFLPLQAAIRLYIEIWRGLPIIVTIFLLFFALPTLADELHFSALNLDTMRAAILGLALWGSAQIAEATRGAVQSIPREQHEASGAAAPPAARRPLCGCDPEQHARSDHRRPRSPRDRAAIDEPAGSPHR
jgi:polar amino acid transport system permease protein